MGEMNNLTKEIKAKALELGFKAVGITSNERLSSFPHGWVADVKDLQSPEDILPGSRSVLMLVLHAWDKAFYMQIDSPLWMGYRLHTPEENIEGYYIIYQISQAKAWPLAWFLREKGFNAVVTESIPMKATAIRCGWGGQGKNTLFLHPELGPRIGLMAILTDAELVKGASKRVPRGRLSLTTSRLTGAWLMPQRTPGVLMFRLTCVPSQRDTL